MIKEASRLNVAETYYFARKLAEIRQMNTVNEVQVINLGIGSPDLPPHDNVIRTLQEAASKTDAHAYQSYKGIPELSRAFADWYKRHFEVSLDSEQQILPLIGSKEGVMHITMSFLNPGDHVLIPNPGYPAYAMTAKLAGAVPIFFDLKEELDWLPDLDEIAAQDLSKVKMMWLNYPNMPTGGKATLTFFNQLLAFGIKNDILICHDNPYTFILNDNPLSIMQANGSETHALELTSLSKNYNMAGWRIGAIAGNKFFIDTILKYKSNMDSGMFKPLQIAAVEALRLGQDWFEYLNGQYTSRKVIAIKIMEALGCKPLLKGAGMFVWAKIPDDILSGEQYADDILEKSKVFITPGSIFGSNGNRFLRISLCSSEAQFNNALERVLDYMKDRNSNSPKEISLSI